MKLTFVACNDFPKLAWLARANLSDKQVEVLHGQFVECRDSFFIEGAWNGDFAAGDFAGSHCIFGSGAVLRGETVIFVTPASTNDRLYWRGDGVAATVSNSLPLLLADIGDELDPNCPHYPEINETILKGISHYAKVIPTVKGSVHCLMYQNLRIASDGMEEVEKAATPHFSCFKDYSDYLHNNYAAIARNARDPARSHPMEIYSTQSRGYDTTAVNALAKDHGIDKVFTIVQSKGAGMFADKDKGKEGNDDGSEICTVLGLTPTRINRRAFERGFPEEYLFYAGMHAMQDANLLDIVGQIPGACLLLTGTIGELWYPDHRSHQDSVNDQLVSWDLACKGLSEMRLSAGFVQLALPYIGARSRPDIVRITASREMDPWRLNTYYDRPIPRRIAEEAGVPRQMFGQVKLASVTKFPSPSIPYNLQLRGEFFEFLVDKRLLRRSQLGLFSLIHRVNAAITFRHRYKLIFYFEKLLSRICGRKVGVPPLWRRLNGSLYCYCVNKRAGEYSMLLRRAHGST